jgi:PTS system mannose-specific IID component
MERNRLPARVLARVVLRSFLLQGSWNFERLQSLGVLYVMAPALRLFYRGEELVAAGKRHLEYFNTHPFMASPVLGAILDLEQRQSRGEEVSVGVRDFRRMVMAPYAAIGDAFFWGGIRPLAAGVAVFIAFLGSLWAPVVYLLLFNLPHLWFRVVGLLGGYFLGLRIVEIVQRLRLPDLAVRLKEVTVVLLGGLSAYLTFFSLKGEGISGGWGLAAIPVVFLLSWLSRQGISVLLMVLAAAMVLVLSAQFG